MRVLLAVATISLFSFNNVLANDVLYVDDNNEITITGVIESIGMDSIDLRHGDKVIDVETDDINDFDDGLKKLLNVGDTVQISGRFDNDDFEAKRILKTDNGAETTTTPVVVEDGDE